MSILLDQYLQSLSESGLMSKDEVDQLLGRLPANKKPANGEEMATLLLRQGKLTKFQAQAVYQGKIKGLVLGDYIILDEIGEGGMGQVFKAQHRRMKRIVALKILPSEMTKSPEAVGRFQQEVEAAAKLIHPNVVTAFDAGEAKKMYFLVMEFVEGQDLESVVAKRGKLPVAEAVNFILQAATGLEYAHHQGVIHRDIKPSNLFLDKNGTVKILDMGLARSDSPTGNYDETSPRALTRTGDVMGTVDFMPPEQASSTKHVDERADIYSLGCTLCYLLTGKPVYDGETLVEKVMAHRDKPIPALTNLRGDVPKSLDLVFRRMVGKKPEYRYRTMTEVIAELKKCDLRGIPTAFGDPARTARPAAETSVQTPHRTERVDNAQHPGPAAPAAKAGSSTPTSRAAPTVHATGSPAPPPPELTPRKRGQTARPQKTVQERAAERKQEFQQEKARKKVWQDAVTGAIQEQKKRVWWDKIKNAVSTIVAGTTKWILVLVILGGGVGGGYLFWQNAQKLVRSRSLVLDAVNQNLVQAHFDPIAAFDFVGVSMVQMVPEVLTFEHPLFQTSAGGRRQTATLKGQFHRVKGLIEISSPSPAQIKTEPVP